MADGESNEWQLPGSDDELSGEDLEELIETWQKMGAEMAEADVQTEMKELVRKTVGYLELLRAHMAEPFPVSIGVDTEIPDGPLQVPCGCVLVMENGTEPNVIFVMDWNPCDDHEDSEDPELMKILVESRGRA